MSLLKTRAELDRGRRRAGAASRTVYYVDGVPWPSDRLALRLGIDIPRLRRCIAALRRRGAALTLEALQ